ncbi:hypothetical protein L1987_15036 [Smallanthus sonchifolius]|uniref:Uncharacterized protein n=1 Tax=Smallanthus sonchifolius TaxID=185202 RepID=A0ACB9J4Z6_9ASTR|nr:hypothetical protein L1987_15036 [Smallanthus sonchifolius]
MVVRPKQSRQSPSPMSTSSNEDERTEKLLSQAITASQKQSSKQISQHFFYTQPPQNPIPPSYFLTQPQPSQNPTIFPKTPKKPIPQKPTTVPKPSTISFGSYALQICTDQHTKFRPISGIKPTDKQQCLLDNLWHVQTMPHASAFKVQILNALSIYFHEQQAKSPETQITKPKFTHYIIFRGTKIGIFNKWETVIKHIQCPGPIYKGYQSFSDALKTAREHFGIDSFYIEPEEVQTFSQITQTSQTQIIKAQEETIAKLQEQLLEQGKNKQSIQSLVEINILKQKVGILEANNTQLLQKLERKEGSSSSSRSYDAFKARMMDTPWKTCLQTLIDQFPEFDNIISQKICSEFPLVIYELQLRVMMIALNEEKYKGVTVVERTDNEGNGTCLLLL